MFGDHNKKILTDCMLASNSVMKIRIIMKIRKNMVIKLYTGTLSG
jgi:hypothetical protein